MVLGEGLSLEAPRSGGRDGPDQEPDPSWLTLGLAAGREGDMGRRMKQGGDLSGLQGGTVGTERRGIFEYLSDEVLILITI